MESGTTLFFDIADGSKKSFHESSFSIGKDPILTLDLLPSSCAVKHSDLSLPAERCSRALLVAAGMAGDAQDVSELNDEEAGRAVLFKTVYSRDDYNNDSWNFQQRARLSTCRVDRETYGGKPGISICRFRPSDGRLLAIGGWDKRIRLFERSKGNLVAILKGSTGSIADLDWAPDSVTSGLLASADKNDKLITLWRCFVN
jgi:WD40 repeat protein